GLTGTERSNRKCNNHAAMLSRFPHPLSSTTHPAMNVREDQSENLPHPCQVTIQFRDFMSLIQYVRHDESHRMAERMITSAHVHPARNAACLSRASRAEQERHELRSLRVASLPGTRTGSIIRRFRKG